MWEILENGENKGRRLERYRERQEIKEPTSLWHWLMSVLFSPSCLSTISSEKYCALYTAVPPKNFNNIRFMFILIWRVTNIYIYIYIEFVAKDCFCSTINGQKIDWQNQTKVFNHFFFNFYYIFKLYNIDL